MNYSLTVYLSSRQQRKNNCTNVHSYINWSDSTRQSVRFHDVVNDDVSLSARSSSDVTESVSKRKPVRLDVVQNNECVDNLCSKYWLENSKPDMKYHLLHVYDSKKYTNIKTFIIKPI